MIIAEILLEGSKAFYDDIPRYKNPYDIKESSDRSESTNWYNGWDSAFEEHRIFTENSIIKEEIQELTKKIEEKDQILKELNEQKDRMEEDLARVQKKLSYASNLLKESEQEVHDLMVYIEENTFFSFSRKKAFSMLSKIWVILTRKIE